MIALQEVNQLQSALPVKQERLDGYHPCDTSVVIREGNHALAVAEGLAEQGMIYHWTWLPVKLGYGRFDEGVAVLSRAPIVGTDAFLASQTDDYSRWKTRKILGALVGGTWFYSVHLGWWDDPEDGFAKQWDRVNRHVNRRDRAILMGDFNSPAEIRDEGYDRIISDGWFDTYVLARDKDHGVTVSGGIAGWTHRVLPPQGARMDYIFCNCACPVNTSRVVFNGKQYPVVSDHFGVMVEI